MKKRKRSAQITLLLAGATALVGVGCHKPAPIGGANQGNWGSGSPTSSMSGGTAPSGSNSGYTSAGYRPSFWSSFWHMGPSYRSYSDRGGSGSWFGKSGSATTPTTTSPTSSPSSSSSSSSRVGSVSRGGFGSSSSHFSSSSSS